MQRTPRQIFGYRLGVLARHWRQQVDNAVKVLDLTEATWRPLLHLGHLGDGIRQKDLAQSLGIEGSTLVRLLDALEERGLLRREDGHDRRCKLISLTPEGRALMLRTREIVTRLEEDMLGGLDDAEMATLIRLLDRVDVRLENDGRPK
ncbi:MAG: MarR family winged helix-turn-helix transcriptional regulator [Bacteroidales bacterium]